MNDHRLQAVFDAHTGGPDELREALINHTYQRLRLLTAKFVGGYPGVRRWEQTDDVLQNASIRLWKSLAEVQPENTASFFGLAATQIRRELIDLARRYQGPLGLGANHATDDGDGENKNAAIARKRDPADGPVTLSEWTDLHECVESLDAEHQGVFDLLYYQGLTQPQAAEVLGLSLRTLKRRWRAARQQLYHLMHGQVPGRLPE